MKTHAAPRPERGHAAREHRPPPDRHAHGASEPHAPRRHSRWWHVAEAVFLMLVAALLVVMARRIDWDDVWRALAGLPPGTLLLAGVLAAASHALYSTYDLLGRAWTGHRLPARRVVAVNFASYAFNLNLGSLVGAFAFRFRQYARLGLPAAVITRVVGLSLVTNWLGYLVLAGVVFAFDLVDLPQRWGVDTALLRALGVALLAAAAAYLAVTAFARRREWTWRGHVIALPPVRLAWWQLAISCTNWLVMAGVITVLLQWRVAYPTVLMTLLVAALAGVLTHIPAGLGVLEAVFLALLDTQVPRGELLAALLAYRALYYLLPLAAACVVTLRLEAHVRGRRRHAARSALAGARPPHP